MGFLVDFQPNSLSVNSKQPQSEVIQSKPGQQVAIIVTVLPSEGHKGDYFPMQLQLKVDRIEFDDHGMVSLVSGISPKMETSLNGEMKVISTNKLVGKGGVVELEIEGGKKLLLPIRDSLTCRINNADFILDAKFEGKGAGSRKAEKGKPIPVRVLVLPSEAHKKELNHRLLIFEVTGIEWDKDGKTIALSGVNPIIRQKIYNSKLNTMVMADKNLKIISPTEKVKAKNGITEFTLAGYEGQKLRIGMKFDQGNDLGDADWLLTPE